MKSIDTATPKEIAKYLEHLYDVAWEKANHKTDEDEDGYAYEVWKALYNFIFSDNISGKLRARFGKLDYYDPDASYYRDVRAYINAFKEFSETYEENNMFPTFETFYFKYYE